MNIAAEIKYIRISPKKAKAYGQAIKGMKAQVAIDRLLQVPDKIGKVLAKAVKTALSNGVNNFKKDKDALFIRTVEIGKGPFFKRFNPVSRGMAHSIKKRTTHIRVILEEINKKLDIKKLDIKKTEIKPEPAEVKK